MDLFVALVLLGVGLWLIFFRTSEAYEWCERSITLDELKSRNTYVTKNDFAGQVTFFAFAFAFSVALSFFFLSGFPWYSCCRAS